MSHDDFTAKLVTENKALQQKLGSAVEALQLVHKNSKCASTAARNILSDIEKSRIKDKDFIISRLERIIDFMEPLISFKAALASIEE